MIPSATKTVYVSALRMKTGELHGLARLEPDVKDAVIPHFIVPPAPERDDEVQSALFQTESVPGAGIVLTRYWTQRPVFLDLEHVFQEFDEARSGLWLPKAFEMARRENVLAVPVASMADLTGRRSRAFKDAIGGVGPFKLALRVRSGELVDPMIGDAIKQALDAAGVRPEDCAVLVDFTDADFSQPSLVAGVIEGAMERLEDEGRWRAIVSQGTSFPEVNPAEHGADVLVPRNEWTAWSSAVRFDARTPDHLVFGDYAADCAKMVFGMSGGRAIRHYRYTTSQHWLVSRGAESGRDQTVMRDVCGRIVRSGYFAGRSFSSADEYIYKTAEGDDGPGNAAIWREINTAHHITRVVKDIGGIKGLRFAEREVGPPARQLKLV